MCIVIIWLSVCDIIIFKVSLSFLWSRFPTLSESQDKHLKILRIKRNFNMKGKAFFITFKEILATRNCLRPKSESLNLVERQTFLHDLMFFEELPLLSYPLMRILTPNSLFRTAAQKSFLHQMVTSNFPHQIQCQSHAFRLRNVLFLLTFCHIQYLQTIRQMLDQRIVCLKQAKSTFFESSVYSC